MRSAKFHAIAVAVSLLVGFFISRGFVWGWYEFLANLFVGYLSLAWRERLAMLIVTIALSLPIGVSAREKAGWYGALAAVTSEVFFLVSWYSEPSPRPEYTFLFVLGMLVQALLFAGFSLLWWKWISAKRLTTQSRGPP